MKKRVYMSPGDIQSVLSLLTRWEGLCIVCGEPFTSLLSVTRDHIVPKSLGGKGHTVHDNVAPCHFRCNQLKGNESLLVAVRLVEERRRTWDETKFKQWLNAKVPRRSVDSSLSPDLQKLLYKKRGQRGTRKRADRAAHPR
jgi:hypothetical protein